MTWAVKLVSVEHKESMVFVTLTYTSDDPARAPVQSVQFGNDLDVGILAQIIAQKLAALDTVDAAFATYKTVPLGDVTPTQLTAVATSLNLKSATPAADVMAVK